MVHIQKHSITRVHIKKHGISRIHVPGTCQKNHDISRVHVQKNIVLPCYMSKNFQIISYNMVLVLLKKTCRKGILWYYISVFISLFFSLSRMILVVSVVWFINGAPFRKLELFAPYQDLMAYTHTLTNSVSNTHAT